MIRRQPLISGGQRCTILIRQLFCMQFYRQTKSLCCDKYLLSLRTGKSDIFTKGVNRIDQPFRNGPNSGVVAFAEAPLGDRKAPVANNTPRQKGPPRCKLCPIERSALLND